MNFIEDALDRIEVRAARWDRFADEEALVAVEIPHRQAAVRAFRARAEAFRDAAADVRHALDAERQVDVDAKLTAELVVRSIRESADRDAEMVKALAASIDERES